MSSQPHSELQFARRSRITAAALWWIIGGAAALVALAGIGVFIALKAPLWGVKSPNLHTAAIHWSAWLRSPCSAPESAKGAACFTCASNVSRRATGPASPW